MHATYLSHAAAGICAWMQNKLMEATTSSAAGLTWLNASSDALWSPCRPAWLQA